MDYLKSTFQNIKKQWDELSKKNKIYIAAGGTALIAIICVWASLSFKTDYVLFLDEDASENTIVAMDEALIAGNIKHKVNETGTNIYVDEESLSEARRAVLSADLPSGTYTWADALNRNTLGMTESDKNVNYKYAKESTLAEDLKTYVNVKNAKVTLTLPTTDPFVLKQTTVAQASILLELDNNLTQKQIDAIKSYILASVEGLKEENLSITDSNANILFPHNKNDETMMSLEYDKIRADRQKEIETRVNSSLAALYSDVRVMVNLKMDFDKYKEDNEIISSPLGEKSTTGLITEQHTKKEESTSTAASGEPGLGSNDEDTSYQMNDNGSNASSSMQETDTVYGVNKKVSQMEREIGTIDLAGSSISVIVYNQEPHSYDELNKQKTFKDKTWLEYKKEVNATQTPIEISEALINNIKSGTGIENVTVSGFVVPTFIEHKDSAGFNWLNLIPIVVLLAVIVGVAIVLVKKNSSVHVVETEPELSVENLLYSTQAKEDELPEIREHVSESFTKISKFIDDQPDLVAQLLRNWINEE